MINGLFINLDRSRDRLRHMEAEFARFNLVGNYQRFRAILNESGAIGCMLSHLKALEYVRRQSEPMHVLEDDVILSSQLQPFLASPKTLELATRYDLLFLDMWVDPAEKAVLSFKDAYFRGADTTAVLDLKGLRVGSASSYIVSPRSAGTVLRLLGRNVRPAIDNRYNDLVQSGDITAAVVVPFLTGIDMGIGTQSFVQSMPKAELVRILMLRTAFFTDRGRQPSMTFEASTKAGAKK